MKITVTAVYAEEVVLVRGTSALGWRGKFGCPLVAGEAIFIPARGKERNLRVGNTITVETGYEEVLNVRVAPDSADGMRVLDNSGDYEVSGSVVSAAPQGDLRISVRGLIFTLERKDLVGVEPEAGQRLTFELKQLVLWDAGL